MAQTFGQLPSDLLRRAAPELAWLSPLDWHVFDTTAALVYQDMLRERHSGGKTRDGGDGWAERGPDGRRSRSDGRFPPSRQRMAWEGQGEELAIVGDEVPPWES